MVLPLVSVSGRPAECGAAYGEAARERIQANLALYRQRFADAAGLDAAAVTRAGQAFRAATRAYHPRIAAMLDGVAEGAGAPVADVYALNARTELIYGGEQECTAVGVLGTHTATGHLLLGQNWDWHPDQRDAILLLQTTDERGHTILTLAEAGMLAKTGLNSAGVGQCLTMLGCDRDGLTDPPGVPYHVLARATLEQDTLAWALRAACRSPRNASINLLLGQAGDPRYGDPAVGGELIDLELVPGDAGWMHPVDGMITHANHLETALPVFDRQKDHGNSSLFRAARARRLLAALSGAAANRGAGAEATDLAEEPVATGKVSTDDLGSLFRDHASFPHAICRHVDERDVPLERSMSACSILLDLDERRLGIAVGPPCEHEYDWLELPGAAG